MTINNKYNHYGMSYSNTTHCVEPGPSGIA